MPKSPILFSRLGSNAEIDFPVAGVAGTRQGTVAYGAGKFGNGVSGCNTSNYVRWTAGIPNIAVMTVEMWVKPALDNESATRFQFLRENTGGLIDIYHYNATNHLKVEIYSPGPTYSPSVNYVFNDITWTADELFHLGVVCNSAAGAGAKVVIYKNGVAITNTSYSEGGGGVWTGTNTNCEIGGSVTSNGIVDNLKIYDYLKTDFSDRENERAGMNDFMYSTGV